MLNCVFVSFDVVCNGCVLYVLLMVFCFVGLLLVLVELVLVCGDGLCGVIWVGLVLVVVFFGVNVIGLLLMD